MNNFSFFLKSFLKKGINKIFFVNLQFCKLLRFGARNQALMKKNAVSLSIKLTSQIRLKLTVFTPRWCITSTENIRYDWLSYCRVIVFIIYHLKGFEFTFQMNTSLWNIMESFLLLFSLIYKRFLLCFSFDQSLFSLF